MEKPLLSFLFTRLLLAIVLANLGCFVFSYILQLKVSLTLPLYLLLLLAALVACKRIHFRPTPRQLDLPSLAMLVIMVLLLMIPRLTYLLDWLPGNTTLSYADDYARILEILAMTANDHYPLLSPSNTDYMFSYYYAGLYPMAVFKLAIPTLTIKESIALGNFFYQVLILLSLYEIAFLLLRDKHKVRVLIFLFTLFGGLDWVAKGDFSVLYGHYEWWQKRFSGNTQLSSFYTGMFWTIHHFLAAYTALLCYVILRRAHLKGRKQAKYLLLLLLLIAIFYTSPFVFLSLLPFLVIYRKVMVQILKRWQAWVVMALCLPPLAIFLKRVSDSPYIWSSFRVNITDSFLLDKLLSFPLYITLIPLVELAAIPLILLAMLKQLRREERALLAAAWSFLILTYLLAYHHGNNFAMRGMLLPTAVFYFLFAYHWPEIRQSIGNRMMPAVFFLALLYSLGTLLEVNGRTRISLQRSQLFSNQFGLHSRDANIRQALKLPLYETATRHDIDSIPYKELPYAIRRYRYDYEKFIDHIRLDRMFGYEKDLLRKPWPHEKRRDSAPSTGK